MVTESNDNRALNEREMTYNEVNKTLINENGMKSLYS